MVETTTIIALLFAVTCGVLVVLHSARVGRVTLLDWALLAIGGMYGLGWPLVLHITLAGSNPSWAPWILPFENFYLAQNMAAYMLLFGVVAGWYVFLPSFNRNHTVSVAVEKSQKNRWSLALWTLLGLSIVTQGLYSMAYDGYIGQLQYSNAIRSSRFDAVPYNPLSFLKPFGGLAMVAAFGFYGLRLSGLRRLGVNLGLFLSFPFSLYVLYSWLGRIEFLIFIATFPLAVALRRARSPLWLLLGGIVLFSTILAGAYFVSVWLNLKTADNLGAFLGRELAFPFGSFFAQLNHGGHLLRGFYDFTLTPIYILPSSWWSQWIEPVSQVNTRIIMGAAKGEGGITGGIPVDLLTLGLMQLHFPGVAVAGFLFGALLRSLNLILDRIKVPGVRSIFEANIALNISVIGVFYSQPNLVVSGNIHWIAAMLVFLILTFIMRVKIRKNPTVF